MYLESKEGIVCCSNGVCVRLPSGLRDSADSALPGRAAQRLHGPVLVQPQRASALQPPQEHAVASPAAARVTDLQASLFLSLSPTLSAFLVFIFKIKSENLKSLLTLIAL